MVTMNIAYMTARKIGMPSARLSTTRSIRSETLRPTSPVRVSTEATTPWTQA